MGTGRRRASLVALTVALVAVLLSACDWTMYRFGASHTGQNPGEAELGVGEAPSLALDWASTPRARGSRLTPVVAEGRIIAPDRDTVYAYDVDASACGGSPASCEPQWTPEVSSIHLGLPAVAHGTVFVGSLEGTLSAFDAEGVDGCTGGPPALCDPLWTSSGLGEFGPPTIAGERLYVVGRSFALKLYVFDALGEESCSGTPKICEPLWTANAGPAPGGLVATASPAVSGGTVYVGNGAGKLLAFDANGTVGCSGTPTTCQRLWTGDTGSAVGLGSPAVASGRVYVGGSALFAFRATGCGAAVCGPLWSAPGDDDPPAVANGIVYSGGDQLRAYDAAGVTGCSGTPKVCDPLWSSDLDVADVEAPAVANGVVYAGAHRLLGCNPFQICSYERRLLAFDATGSVACAGTTALCDPIWEVSALSTSATWYSDPIVADGTLYVVDPEGPTTSYDELLAFREP